MAKTAKFIIGSLVVVAAAGAGLHFLAPVYTENNLRSALTNPQSMIRGEFTNFQMSLFKGTMSGDNVKIVSMDGAVYSAQHVDITGIDWLAVYGFNPSHDALAQGMTLGNATIEVNGRKISFDQARLAGVSADPTNWLPDTFAAADITSPGLTQTFEDQTSTIEDIHIQDIAADHIGGITTGAWSYDAGPDQGNARIAQSIFANCAGPMPLLQQLDNSDFNWNSAESCKNMALADLTMSLPDHSAISAAGILVDGLTTQSIETTSVNGLKIRLPKNGGALTIGRIELGGFDQAINPDLIPAPGEKFDIDQWLAAFESVKIDKLELSDQLYTLPEAEIRWDHLAIHKLAHNVIGEFSSGGLSVHGSNVAQTLKIGLDQATLRDVDLANIGTVLRQFQGVTASTPEEQLAEMQDKTLGEVGFPFNPPVLSTYLLTGIELGITGSETFHLTLDELGGALGDVGPAREDGPQVARAASSHIGGFSIDIPDEISTDPRVTSMLGVERFDQVTLDIDAHQRWNAENGEFQYGVDELTVHDFGTVKFSVTLAGLTSDVIGQLQDIPLIDAKQRIGKIFSQSALLKDASLEISGENLMPTVWKIAAATSGVPADQLQLTAGMVVVQAQQQYGKTGQLGASLGQLANWLAAPHRLKITLSPPKPVAFGPLMKAQKPPTPPVLAETFGLKILANDEVGK
ncbi:hypothetical protein [Thalassospira mesophila]|uniref:Uncharacterized protein n=1 Tax=Thalassospira mesophila TaxID=1293891 RepID=A0A1Y2L1P5_9PROT|nr:hypothetical protein [Thalassospira mesophila]OSQ39410.1 hypothetical protein TMES_04970 [Thalassospira mesophila]